MLAQDHLSMQTVRLVPGQEWNLKGEGLCFFFPQNGSGRCVSPRGVQTFTKADVVVLDLASFEKVCADRGGELLFNYFTLSFEHLLPLFVAKDVYLLNSVRDVLKNTKVYPAPSPLALECHRLLKEVPPQFELDHRGQLIRIVSSILALELKQAHSQRLGLGHAEAHITRVLEQLSIDEIFRLSVDELAQKFGCSARHLNRLFHQYFGFSVAALRMEMRMLKAVSLLRNPDLKILDVAGECGFNYLSLFNDCFKKRFGNTPGGWRKLHAGKPDFKGQRPPLDAEELGCPLRFNGLCPWSPGGVPTSSAAPPTTFPSNHVPPQPAPHLGGFGPVPPPRRNPSPVRVA